MSVCISYRVFSCSYCIIAYTLIAPALRPLWRSYDLADWRWPQ
jgi:hypothetical protein